MEIQDLNAVPEPEPLQMVEVESDEDHDVPNSSESVSTRLVGWFVKGLGRMVPQPVLKPRENASVSEKTAVQNICICQQSGPLKVEEIEETQEVQEKEVEEEVKTGQEGDQPEQEDPQDEFSELTQVSAAQQEETETHTEATMTTIEENEEKVEPGSGEVNSQTEGNVQPEEDQATHLAEEATQASSTEQSASIQEKETEDLSEYLDDNESVDNISLPVSTATEPIVSRSKEAEPKNTKSDSMAQLSTSQRNSELSIVTKQPDSAKDVHPPSAVTQDDETADEGCGVPVSCIAVKNWLMQLPHTSECLANFNQLLRENAITLPKMPCKPGPGLTCQNLLHVPPQFSQLPQRLQQYYVNILERLSSLKPEQDT
ncbi:hypothetical protein GJAV_G00228910 [Gymnothorax javanicus]|nr:hypothetical protein GJAV_G00228910 [Gymnothorax javanicus]